MNSKLQTEIRYLRDVLKRDVKNFLEGYYNMNEEDIESIIERIIVLRRKRKQLEGKNDGNS